MRACVRPQSRNNGWTCLCSVERTKPALPSWSNDWLRASMVGFRGGLLVCVVDFDEPCRCPRRVKQQGATGQPGNAGPGDDGGSAVFQGAPRLADRQLCGGWVVSLGRERVEERHGGPAQQRRSLTDGVFRWGHLACQRNRNTHCIARHEAGPRGAMSVPYDANIDGGKGATATGGRTASRNTGATGPPTQRDLAGEPPHRRWISGRRLAMACRPCVDLSHPAATR